MESNFGICYRLWGSPGPLQLLRAVSLRAVTQDGPRWHRASPAAGIMAEYKLKMSHMLVRIPNPAFHSPRLRAILFRCLSVKDMSNWSTSLLGASLCWLVSGGNALPAHHQSAAPVVAVKNGSYAGIHSAEYNQDFFLGMPYAQVCRSFYPTILTEMF